MDIQQAKEAMSLLGMAITNLVSIKNALPKGQQDPKQIDDAIRNIEQAERALKMSQAITAKELGYEICRNHMPPGIMISKDDENWKCPDCGNEKGTGPIAVSVPFRRSSR